MALDAAVRESRNGAQVIEAGHTSGRDHRGVGAVGNTGQQVQIGAAQGAVLGDIGHDEPRTSFTV